MKSSGGDYTTLNAALAGESTDLVSTLVGILTIECWNFADTTAASTGTGYTTDATHYINIIGRAADKTASNTGKWSTDRYRLSAGANYTSCLKVEEAYTRISDLQIDFSGAQNEGAAPSPIWSAASNVQITRCVLRRSGSGSVNGITVYGGLTTDISNCVIYDCTAGIRCGPTGSSTTISVYNNTVHGCVTGIDSQAYTTSTLNLKNNLCNGNTTDYYFEGGHTRVTSTNLSEDTTSPESALQNKACAFVNEANDDFHLASNDTNAINAGSDLSATFTIDIDGETRPTGAGTWDIGADEYVAPAGGGSVVPVFMNQYRQRWMA